MKSWTSRRGGVRVRLASLVPSVGILGSLGILAGCAAGASETKGGEEKVSVKSQALAVPSCLARASHELRIHAILLLDDAARSNCTALSPCTTPADITNFVNLANGAFAPANIHFVFDEDLDFEELVDPVLNSNLQSGFSNPNWPAANAIAAGYPGKIVVFLREVANSNFAYPPNTGQAAPVDAPFPPVHPNFVAFNGDRATALANAQNFSHELGHFLGLYHTHLTWGNSYPGVPPADGCPKPGGACSPAELDQVITDLQTARGANALDGDLIADTPEDPGPTYWATNGLNPATVASVTVNGVTYTPDRQNVMSYFGGFNLTNGQVTAVLNSICDSTRSDLVSAPVARCLDQTVSVDAACVAQVTPAMIDDGSFDPNGDPITLALDTTGPFSPGATSVKLLVSDGTYTTPCTANLTVVDSSPPVLTAPADVSVTICTDSSLVTVGQASAVDNCSAGVPSGQVISKNGTPLSSPIPVIGGQVALGPGSYVIEWSVSDGANTPVTATQTVTVGAAIVASNMYQVRDRASVEDTSGNPAAVLNAGTGITNIGGDNATVGPIVAGGDVNVAWGGYVYGDITAVGTVQVNDPTKHLGSTISVSSVALPAPPALPTFPPPTGGDQWVNPGTDLPLPPGSYGQIGLNGNPNDPPATLRLSAGDYFFTNLYFNSAGLIVVAEPGTRIFVSGSVTFNTSIRTAVGSNVLAPVVLGVSGSGALPLYAPFTGTVVAPQRDLVLGTSPAGMTFKGSFYARSIDVTPDSVLVCDPTIAAQEPASCSNGVLDPGETDVDCGGPQCNACGDGGACSLGDDCTSQVCTAGICQAPTCTDGVQNGTETGEDCGGTCSACPVTCNGYTYQAESMYHSTGNAWWQGGWNIYSNGYISTTHYFTPGPKVITVSALGQEALGLPHMAVSVGGTLITPTGGYSVTTGGFNPYQFTFNAAGGPQEIRVIFDNDASGWFGDRNLIVRTVAVSCP